MPAYQKRCVLIACGVAAMLSMQATSDAGPILDWLCGTSPCTNAQTTYTPPYYAAEYAAPAYAAPAGGCSSCAPQVVQYAPYASYRPVYTALTAPRPVTTYYYPTAANYPTTACSTCATPTTAYYPTSACGSCATPVTSYYAAPACNTCAAPVTAYRPVVAFTQQVRLIPYTTYRMAYMPMTSVGYAPVYSTCASPCASSCGSCGSAGYEGATTYESSSCASCQPAISSTYAAPPAETPSYSAPMTSSAPSTESTQPPKTFQEQQPPAGETKSSYPENNTTSPANTPASEPDLKPIPRSDTQLNSLPEPRLIDPDNRTTSSPLRQAIYLVKRSALADESIPAQKNGGWRESGD